MNPTLHLVSVPIGNPLDLNLRAMEVLKTADLIIGEEYNLYSKRTKTQDLLAKLDMLGLEGVLPWFLDEFKNLQQSILESEDKRDPSYLSSVSSYQQALVKANKRRSFLGNQVLVLSLSISIRL